MHIYLLFIVLFVCFPGEEKITCGKQGNANGMVSHDNWNTLLKKHVKSSGQIDYKGFLKEKQQLRNYLVHLACIQPESKWSRERQMAYWINLYNALTVDLVLGHYPINSIKDIGGIAGSPWEMELIEIQGKSYTLNHVEHQELREKFKDPRIHFVVNCASVSCPRLEPFAIVPEKLNEQMEAAAVRFINDNKYNKITSSHVQLSKIFEWFKDDFTQHGSLIDYLNKYSRVKINPNAKISYLEYDWGLNE